MVIEHLVFPVRCPACELTSVSFCGLCRPEVEPWEPSICLRCGAGDAGGCLCSELPEQVTGIRALWRFDGPVVDVVELAKYRGELWRLKALKQEVAVWLRAQVSCMAERPAVIPVAPSARRLRRRGFDLPLILARWAVRGTSASMRCRVLRRVRDVPAQAGQDRVSRFASIADAFRARRCPEQVILIDDVITTGATVSACATALAQAGAQRIGILALARTPRG